MQSEKQRQYFVQVWRTLEVRQTFLKAMATPPKLQLSHEPNYHTNPNILVEIIMLMN